MRKESDTKYNFQPGQLVTSKAGHDKGKLYVVLEICGERLWVADGHRKNTAQPKLKNIKHVQKISCILSPEGDVLTDDEIKEAIKCYASKCQKQEEE